MVSELKQKIPGNRNHVISEKGMLKEADVSWKNYRTETEVDSLSEAQKPKCFSVLFFFFVSESRN